jgi:hypothetical protein
MNRNDDFDKFLQSNLQKTEHEIEDDGFTQRVISNLPTIKFYAIKRNYILYLASILSVLIFFISSGYKSLLASLADIYNSLFLLIKPSIISIFVISVFIGVSVYIAINEYNENAI